VAWAIKVADALLMVPQISEIARFNRLSPLRHGVSLVSFRRRTDYTFARERD
jgi:hypothetical protein